MLLEAIRFIILVMLSGFFLTFGIVFIRSVMHSSAAEAHASSMTNSPSAALCGDYPTQTLPGKPEAQQCGMSYDRVNRRFILQGKLSDEYIDDLVR